MTVPSIILPPLAALYGTATRTRLALYQTGVLKASKLDAPVISVGNITAGGTGKTPLVEYLARIAAGTGKKVCILTRGYGREHPDQRVLVSDGTGVLATEKEAGDEPLLLAQKLKGIAAVISDANRTAAGKWAISNLNSEVFILDDGFQHLRLARNLNVLAIDASDPWGNGKLLPRGLLREPIQGLRRADCIVLTRTDQAGDLDKLNQKIRSINGTSPVFKSRMLGRGTFHLHTGESVEKIPEAVAAFSAIGNQNSFIRQLKAEKVEPLEIIPFRDHHRYSQSDINEIESKAKRSEATCLITTAKDAVKLTSVSVSMPCYVLDIEIEIEETDEFVSLVLAAIK
jgi:tetraacyldisaccharide 4'-kinase